MFTKEDLLHEINYNLNQASIKYQQLKDNDIKEARLQREYFLLMAGGIVFLLYKKCCYDYLPEENLEDYMGVSLHVNLIEELKQLKY